MSVRDELELAFNTYRQAKMDGEWTVREVGTLIGVCLGAMSTAALQFTGDDEQWEMLVKDAEDFATDVIVPWDIPGVGNFIEAFVDSQIVGAVRPLMESIRPKR